MSPERGGTPDDHVDKRLGALESHTDKRVEALTERILSLEKEQARLEVLLEALRVARPRGASH